MTTTTTSARENMWAEQARQRRAVLENELAHEHRNHADYVRNMVGGAYTSAELARDHLAENREDRVVSASAARAILATYAGILTAETARHDANVARIVRALDAIPGGAS